MTDRYIINKANMIMTGIEFVGHRDRYDEVASVYKYLGLESGLVNPQYATETDCQYRFIMHHSNKGICAVKAEKNTKPYFIRLILPHYDIGIRDENPAEFLRYLDENELEFKRKFDIVNTEIVENRKRINNAKRNLADRVELVDDFIGTGNRFVSAREFKAYITGLSVRNHHLKKKAKALFSKYMQIRRFQDFIVTQYVGEDRFEKFYKEYVKVCKKHRKEDSLDKDAKIGAVVNHK